jgi:hypothetical protein
MANFGRSEERLQFPEPWGILVSSRPARPMLQIECAKDEILAIALAEDA